MTLGVKVTYDQGTLRSFVRSFVRSFLTIFAAAAAAGASAARRLRPLGGHGRSAAGDAAYVYAEAVDEKEQDYVSRGPPSPSPPPTEDSSHLWRRQQQQQQQQQRAPPPVQSRGVTWWRTHEGLVTAH